jgi:hypothetical protein
MATFKENEIAELYERLRILRNVVEETPLSKALDDEDEMEDVAESESAPTSAPRKIVQDIDPERLSRLKDVAKHWLNHSDQIRKQRADAKKNPHLFAEGHRIAAHNTAHADFNTAHQELLNSDEYKNLDPFSQMEKELTFKKEWQARNPDFHHNASRAVGEAHGTHAKAKDAYKNELANKKAHILTGGQGAADQTFSAQEAAQHVGGGKDDDGMYSSTIIQDPSSSFAAANKAYLAAHSKPRTMEDYEELESPEMKVIKHPSLDHPENKKMLNDFFKDHHPLIQRAVKRAKDKANDSGISDDMVDMGTLHEVGMRGLMHALNDYNPEVGSFKNHANNKMAGMMQSHIAGHDPVPRDMRAQAKFFDQHKDADWSKLKQEAPEPAPAAAAPAPAQSVAPKTDIHQTIANSGHPNSADMADRVKRVIVRKKGAQ